MVLLLVGLECIFLQALQNETDDVWRDHAGVTMIVGTNAGIDITIAVLSNSIAGDSERSGNLPLAFSFYEEHMPDFFIVFHSDNHLVAIPSHLIVLTQLYRME